MQTLNLKRCSSIINLSTVSNLKYDLEHLKELFLHYRFERIDDYNDFAQQIMLNASLKSTPINVKINCYEDVRCFLGPVEEDAASIASKSSAANEMVDEGVDYLIQVASYQMSSPTPIRRVFARQTIMTHTNRMYTFIPIVTNNSKEI